MNAVKRNALTAVQFGLYKEISAQWDWLMSKQLLRLCGSVSNSRSI